MSPSEQFLESKFFENGQARFQQTESVSGTNSRYRERIRTDL